MMGFVSGWPLLAAIVLARNDPYKNLIAILDGKTAKVLQAVH